MSDIKVLHIVQTPLDFAGGPATYVCELSKHLAKKGIRVGIVSPKPARFTEDIKLMGTMYGIETYFVDLKFFRSLLRAPWMMSIKAHKLVSYLVKNYDIINVHVESTFMQQITGAFNSARVIATVHGIYPYEDIEVLKYNPSNFYRLFRLMFISPQHWLALRSLISKSKVVISVAEYLARILCHMYDFDNSEVIVIPNSVDTEFFKPIKRTLAFEAVTNILNKKGYKQSLEDTHIILYLGRLDPRKGLHILLKSLTKFTFKEWVLIIVGEGSHNYLRRLRELTTRLGLSKKICFTGKVPRNLLPYFYSAAHVYVLPSMFEGLPATILEAMACGTPVVATNVSGIPEAIDNYRNGLMIDSLSDDQLTNAIEYILSDSNVRKRLSEGALKIVQERFSWSKNVEKYIMLYRNLV